MTITLTRGPLPTEAPPTGMTTEEALAEATAALRRIERYAKLERADAATEYRTRQRLCGLAWSALREMGVELVR